VYTLPQFGYEHLWLVGDRLFVRRVLLPALDVFEMLVVVFVVTGTVVVMQGTATATVTADLGNVGTLRSLVASLLLFLVIVCRILSRWAFLGFVNSSSRSLNI